jgi:hypothetical protein
VIRRQNSDVVTSVETQAQQAAELAAIEGQARLADPRSNPAVRDHADRLRDAQHRKVLDAEHTRVIRRYRVADMRAGDAERTLELIQAARQATSPARSVMALHVGRSRFMGVALVASLALSVGSATGMARLAAAHGASPLAGWVAEIGLTGLATASILYRSHIAAHGGVFAKGSWQDKVLWALTVVPLLTSVVGNAMSNGVVGVFCSAGAAAFSLLSAVISDTSSATLHDQATRVSEQDMTRLQAVAMGDGMGEDLLPVHTEATEPPEAAQDAGGVDPEEGTGSPLSVTAEEPPALIDWVQGVVDAGAAELEAWLALGDDAVDDADDDAEPVPPAHGPEGGQRVVPRAAETPELVAMLPPVSIDRDQGGDGPVRVLPATQARLAIGASTREKVAAYQAEHPGASVAQVARALKVSPGTVKNARRVLRGGGRS